MITLDDYLLNLYKNGMITGEVCLERAHYLNEMREKMMGLLAGGDDEVPEGV
jgi:Tfp pilus assembly ATPase PilU